jgi:hypothetical protein
MTPKELRPNELKLRYGKAGIVASWTDLGSEPLWTEIFTIVRSSHLVNDAELCRSCVQALLQEFAVFCPTENELAPYKLWMAKQCRNHAENARKNGHDDLAIFYRIALDALL